jgi:hypothetical protein
MMEVAPVAKAIQVDQMTVIVVVLEPVEEPADIRVMEEPEDVLQPVEVLQVLLVQVAAVSAVVVVMVNLKLLLVAVV